MTDLADVASEAIDSALYNMPFVRFLGERKDPVDGSVVAWFLMEDSPRSVREDPKKVRIAVRRHPLLEGVVEVRAEWFNVSGGERLLGQKTFHIPTLLKGEIEAREATEEVVLGLLSIYSDVLGGVGVAGPIDKILPDTESDDEDPDEDPDEVVIPEGAEE